MLIYIYRYNWNPVLQFITILFLSITWKNEIHPHQSFIVGKEAIDFELSAHENKVIHPTSFSLSHVEVSSSLHNRDHETISLLLFLNLSKGKEQNDMESRVASFLDS